MPEDHFVRRQNIQRYVSRLCSSNDRREQLLVLELLVEELKRQREASERATASAGLRASED